MAKMKFGGKEYDVADDLMKAMNDELEKVKGDAAKAEKDMKKDHADELAALAKKEEKAAARADALTAEIADIRKARTDSADPKVLREAVKARLVLEKVAASAGVEKFDGMDDQELKRAVILKRHPDVKLDGKSASYVDARFDVAAEAFAESDSAAAAIGKNIQGRKDGETETMDADAARQKMITRQQNAWKGKEKEGA